MSDGKGNNKTNMLKYNWVPGAWEWGAEMNKFMSWNREVSWSTVGDWLKLSPRVFAGAIEANAECQIIVDGNVSFANNFACRGGGSLGLNIL